jgi:glycosyltransferase involved in cell wall biosynthesis
MDARCQEVSETHDRLHICLVTETYPPEINGVAMTLHRLVSGLIDRGHHLSLVRPRQSAHDRPGCSRVPEQALIPGLPIPGYRGLRFGLPVGQRLRRLWDSSRPDVIYVATEGPLGISALRQAEKLGIPIISGFHTNFHSYTRHYHLGFLNKIILSHLRKFHNRTRTTLVPSEDLQHQLEQTGFNNVEMLARGVDCSLFSPDKRDHKIRQMWGVKDNQFVVLYVGRLATEKNMELFIRAYRTMQQQRSDLRCVMVGDGPLYRHLQLNNPDIIFCGMHTGRSLAAHYASADIFLFPSETETFGNVTLEAMASGLAVVAYDYAAAQRHITDRQNGFIVPFKADDLFIERAIELVSGDTNMTEIRQNARNYALSIDWFQIIERFENILRENCNIPQAVS